MKKVTGRIVDRESLSERMILTMFSLMGKYYRNVTYETFLKDLSEKQKAIVLLDESGEVRGFSTIMLLSALVRGEEVSAVFSGDTIVDKEYRNNMELSICFSSYLRSIIESRPRRRHYWFLICKGYKTYRHLPVFFKDFYPCFDKETPAFEKEAIDAFSFRKFAGRYDPLSGIIEMGEDAVAMKCAVAEREQANRNDPHIDFFLKRNHGFVKGDELACVARIEEGNMTKAFFRASKNKGGA